MPPDFWCGVKRMIEYIIPIAGLGLGDHRYTFKIDKEFFSSFEYFDTDNGQFDLIVDLTKESNLMDFKFHFKGWVELKCDRCLEKFKLDVEDNFRLIVKYAEGYEEISDEIITVPSTESNIDLNQYIYEYINLMLPIKKVHPDDENGNFTCDEDMIDRLNNYLEQKSDPRWDALKNLNLD